MLSDGMMTKEKEKLQKRDTIISSFILTQEFILKKSNKLFFVYFKRISSKIIHKKYWNNSKNIISIRRRLMIEGTTIREGCLPPYLDDPATT